MHLPFWAAWGRGVAWAFGQQQVGSGDKKRWEARERKFVRELSWNSPACEVGEFGVRQIGLGKAARSNLSRPTSCTAAAWCSSRSARRASRLEAPAKPLKPRCAR
jgi:hypothetical protein